MLSMFWTVGLLVVLADIVCRLFRLPGGDVEVVDCRLLSAVECC